ncbi:TerB family tellurite resistance protein [Pontivivens insulae]|uniref:Co-chaperone DjlA N-terminal domain-containing protein n=1 Tax=Pontivivens insulae TaxID=1639689 RepID=A0A2R8AC36_9RHOB|nr:TerB family tellurite resistance protein [Pontivivens insulae]RED11026.1 putative tellurite resistance protein B-like protein [Pontivivens insulae]SPF29799.1 hypothetical protein POI8812_02117 [Pontivivens insulae]
MLSSLIAMLKGDAEPATLAEEDCRLALTAMMVRVARADDQYDQSEKDAIDAVLTDRYGLDATAAAELRASGESVEAEASDNVRFTKVIKDAVPYEERSAVAEALWYVALADDKRTEDENAFLRLVVSLIGVNDRDSGFARQRAEARRTN